MIGAALNLSGVAAWLVDTLFATSLLCMLVLAVRRPVARHFGPQVAYALWLIPAVRMVLPPLPQLFPALNLLPGEAPAAALLPSDAIATDMLAAHIVPAAAVPEWLVSALLTLWLGGAAVMLTTQWMVHRRLVRLLDHADLVEQIGRVRLYQSDRIDGPVSFGLLNPVVILPDAHILPLSPAERALAVRHELAHHARGDLWANGCAVLLAALHWFNPLTRAAWRAFRFDQEAACDATVLCSAEHGSRGVYARALAKAASGHPSAFASPMVRQDRLKDRLAMLANPDPSNGRRRAGLAAAIAMLLGALAITATPVLADPVDPPHAPEPPRPLHVEGASVVDVRETDGDHVARIRRGNRSYVFRSDRPLSQADIDRMMAEADRSRAEAERMAAEGRRAGHEAREAAEEARLSREEIDAIVNDAHREAAQARAEALREAADDRAEALREAAAERQHALQEAEDARAEARQARVEALREAAQARAEAHRAIAEARRGDVAVRSTQAQRSRVIVRDQRRAPAAPQPPVAIEPPAPPSVPTVTRSRFEVRGQGASVTIRTRGNAVEVKPAVLLCDEAADSPLGSPTPGDDMQPCTGGRALQLQLTQLRQTHRALSESVSASGRDGTMQARVLAEIARQIARLEAVLSG